MAVLFQQQLPAKPQPIAPIQRLLHGGDRHQLGFDNSPRGLGFWEGRGEIRREARQALLCFGDVGGGQPDVGQPCGQRCRAWIEPGDWL